MNVLRGCSTRSHVLENLEKSFIFLPFIFLYSVQNVWSSSEVSKMRFKDVGNIALKAVITFCTRRATSSCCDSELDGVAN